MMFQTKLRLHRYARPSAGINFRIIKTAHCADPLGGINLECVSSLSNIALSNSMLHVSYVSINL